MKIELRAIQKSFGSLEALKPFSLTIPSGTFVSLLGPSGCGKTTLLRIIAGLEEADSGTIKMNDQIIYSNEKNIHLPPQKRGIGMVFQDFALWPHMTVFENVAYSLKATGKKKGLREKVDQALENVQLGDYRERYPHQLSGGQQQRVAIARAIANDPAVILMDEPLSALDATLRDEMRILLQSLVKRLNMTAIYVTHDQNEAMSMSDYVVVMNAGTLLQEGTPEDIYRYPQTKEVAAFIGKGTIWDGHLQTQGDETYLKVEADLCFPLTNNTAKIIHNEPCTIVVRPEHVRLSQLMFNGAQTGVIESVSFLGERYEVTFRVGQKEKRLFAYSYERFTPGQQIYFTILADSIHFIQPLGGITNETA
ncbi:ABC transporter ATP-binding protein [Alkalihalobacillus oceani]|uniref:Carnitine transport ATP-binding protein OpuCA n=1 Tax=Halalkalibacter oceani TaxID=1653776 RepID=A0A9X2DN05_9BACI|nr:ABC transporter ATP-binding protein [Halalkalibacter oceani]MCM3713846.1 ABC transporter ATP-binding protein [Halalkalibacter oceani]